MGRPTDYEPDVHPELAKEYCLLGYTDKALCKAFGISETTLNVWKRTYPQFKQSLKDGKSKADAKVANAFFRRATGYDYDSEKIVVANGYVERVATVTHIPPDAGAALSWLKNRQPELWRDKKDVELTGEITVTLNLDGEPTKTDVEE